MAMRWDGSKRSIVIDGKQVHITTQSHTMPPIPTWVSMLSPGALTDGPRLG